MRVTEKNIKSDLKKNLQKAENGVCIYRYFYLLTLKQY